MNKQNKVILMIIGLVSMTFPASDDGFSTPPQTPRNQNHNVNNTGMDPLTPENTGGARGSQDTPPPICVPALTYLQIGSELKELRDQLQITNLISKNFLPCPDTKKKIMGFLFKEERLNKAKEFLSKFPANDPRNDPKKLAEIRCFLDEDIQPAPASDVMNDNVQQYQQPLLQDLDSGVMDQNYQNLLFAFQNMPPAPDLSQAQQNPNWQAPLDILMHNGDVPQEVQSTEIPSDRESIPSDRESNVDSSPSQ